MGKQFGSLQRLYGINFYVLSPYELKPFKGMINPGIMNTLRRIRENVFVMGIPFLYGFLTYKISSDTYIKSHRKNPDDFKDDV